MVDNIVQKTCVPCKGGIPPLTRETKVSVNTFQLLYSISYSF